MSKGLARGEVGSVRIRFNIDADGTPHIHGHNIQTFEVHEALSRNLETVRGRDESFIAIGQTAAGRYLKVIYVPARDGDGIFVVTAYDVPAKQLRALKRRLRRRSR